MNKCAACGSDRIEDAQLEGMAVRLDRASTLKKVFNVGGLVRCRVCLQCGALGDLRGDPEKLAAMVELIPRCGCPGSPSPTRREAAFFPMVLRRSCAAFVPCLVLVLALGSTACGEDDTSAKPDASSTTTSTGAGGTGGGTSSGTGGEGGGVSPECAQLASDLQTALETGHQASGARGAVLGVVTPQCGKWTGAAGDSTPDDPMQPDYLVRIGSITKTFVSATVLQLVSEGKLGLEDPLSTWAASFPGADGITVHQLLDHTSGIFNYTEDATWLAELQATPDKKWAPQELVDVAAAQPPYFAPGAGWRYSNTNYVLAGMIVEAVTQQKLSAALRERLLGPVGLDATTFDGEEAPMGVMAHGWSGSVDATNAADPSAAWAAGAIVSNTSDLVDWAMALYDGNDVLDATAKASLLDTVPTGQNGVEYGLGVLVFAPSVGDGNTLWGHDGGIWGFQSQMFYLPDRHIAFAAIVSSSNDSPNDISLAVLDLLGK